MKVFTVVLTLLSNLSVASNPGVADALDECTSIKAHQAMHLYTQYIDANGTKIARQLQQVRDPEHNKTHAGHFILKALHHPHKNQQDFKCMSAFSFGSGLLQFQYPRPECLSCQPGNGTACSEPAIEIFHNRELQGDVKVAFSPLHHVNATGQLHMIDAEVEGHGGGCEIVVKELGKLETQPFRVCRYSGMRVLFFDDEDSGDDCRRVRLVAVPMDKRRRS